MCDINKNEMLMGIADFSVDEYLEKLLVDKTTGKNIIFATDDYVEYRYDKRAEMTVDAIRGMDADAIQPRVKKSQQEQAERTKKKAEVFTPAWICNRMNNHCDEEWFGRKEVFNREYDTEDGQHKWAVSEGKITFTAGLDWKKYVDSKRLEITCGEAPYIVSRYDAASGKSISLPYRIGIFDRKMRVVNENTDTEEEWLEWAYKALQACYGYEFQGDNLLIARINVLLSFVEYMQDRWHRVPSKKEVCKICNIIAWNLWQMDGLTGLIPFRSLKAEQNSLFDFAMGNEMDEQIDDTPCECRIYDWRANKSLLFNSIKHSSN